MPREFAGVVISSLSAADILLQCKGKVAVKIIRTYKLLSPETKWHVLEFVSKDDMINACVSDLLDFSVLPLKNQKLVSKTTFVAHPESAGNLPSAAILGAHDIARDLDRIQQSLHEAVQDGSICPCTELQLPVTRLYSTDLYSIPRTKRERAAGAVPPNTFLALEGKGSESLARKLNGALVESNVETSTKYDHTRSKRQVQGKPLATVTSVPSAQPRAQASSKAHTSAIIVDAATQNDERSRCSTPISSSQHLEAVKSLQQQLPPVSNLVQAVGRIVQQHRRFFAVPTTLVGIFVGRNFVHLNSIRTSSGADKIVFMDEAVEATMLHHCLRCLVIDASSQANADMAINMLYQRLASIPELQHHTGFCGQGPAWTPPAQSAPRRAVGPTSYGAATPAANEELKMAKAMMDAKRAATFRGGRTGGKGKGKSKGQKGRALPEMREQLRQEKDRCASPPDSSDHHGFCLLCLNASPTAGGGEGTDGGDVLVVADATTAGSGKKNCGSKGKQRAKKNGEGIQGNPFAALQVEGLDGQPTQVLQKTLRQGRKALKGMDALAARLAKGAALDRQQQEKLGKRGALCTTIEAIEEILKERASGAGLD